MFKIYYSINGREQGDAGGAVYDTLEEAQAAVDERCRPGGTWHVLTVRQGEPHVFAPRAVTWKEREAHKLVSGAHKNVVWAKERFWTDAVALRALHYAHISTEDPTMLAYTPSEEYGERDRQNRIKPGKYLQKYFGASEKTGLIGFGPYKGHSPKLNPKEIAYYAEWWEKGSKPSKFGAWELRYAKTGAEIAEVYINGPRSCMSAGQVDGGSNTKTSPTRVYGAGDLQLAYLWDGEKPRARALCWPDKKVFGRCYPAEQNYATDRFKDQAEALSCQQELRARLLAQGWTDIYKDPNVFVGARLRRLKHGKGGNHYVMPYLDNDYGVNVVPDDDSIFVMARTDPQHHCSTTGGYILVVRKFTCQKCRTSQPAEHTSGESLISKVFTGYADGVGTNPQDWCQRCSRYSMTCMELEGRFADALPMTTLNGKRWLKAHVDANKERLGLYKCALSGQFFTAKEFPPVNVGSGGVAPRHLVADYGYFICGFDNTAYKHSEASLKFCGFPKSLDGDTSISDEDRTKHDPRIRTMTWNLTYMRWMDVPGFADPSHFLHEWSGRKNRADEDRKRRAEIKAAKARPAEMTSVEPPAVTVMPAVTMAAE